MSTLDPICGQVVDPAQALTLSEGGETRAFCSEYCRSEYRRQHPTPRHHEARPSRRIAYLSMEIAADPRMPTYAGGLGVLAGDMLRAAADLQVPMLGLSLLHRRGYFRQQLDAVGEQHAVSADWDPAALLTRLAPLVSVPLGDHEVLVRAWRYDFVGRRGYVVPAFFLDTDLPSNREGDRHLTDALYGDGPEYRLAQEVVLGVGGVRLLPVLGYRGVRLLHLNEGHAALGALELLRQQAEHGGGWEPSRVRSRCVFTTHTPVPAGHDQFDAALVERLLPRLAPRTVLEDLGGKDRLNMTLLALNLSHRVNGVAARHEEVSETMFPGRDLRHVTNGVHSVTWTCEPMRALYDRHIPRWRDDPSMLRHTMSLPRDELWAAHDVARRTLFARVQADRGRVLDPARLTLGFARRSTGYKRPDLVFHDLERLRALGRGRLQLVFAGKAHPHDEGGKALIRHVFALGRALGDDVPVVYLPDYDVDLAKVLIAGSDVWLNTPLRPFEASGTSGMKAAHNGVPSLSVLDGWWVEGCIEGVTGWAIGGQGPVAPLELREVTDADDADALYAKLADVVLPLFEGDRARWVDVMRASVAINASFFNAHRMVQQYVTSTWLADGAEAGASDAVPGTQPTGEAAHEVQRRDADAHFQVH